MLLLIILLHMHFISFGGNTILTQVAFIFVVSHTQFNIKIKLLFQINESGRNKKKKKIKVAVLKRFVEINFLIACFAYFFFLRFFFYQRSSLMITLCEANHPHSYSYKQLPFVPFLSLAFDFFCNIFHSIFFLSFFFFYDYYYYSVSLFSHCVGCDAVICYYDVLSLLYLPETCIEKMRVRSKKNEYKRHKETETESSFELGQIVEA